MILDSLSIRSSNIKHIETALSMIGDNFARYSSDSNELRLFSKFSKEGVPLPHEMSAAQAASIVVGWLKEDGRYKDVTRDGHADMEVRGFVIKSCPVFGDKLATIRPAYIECPK